MKTIGAEYLGDGRCVFTVWAPLKKKMVLHLIQPKEQKLPMERADFGYFRLEMTGVEPGTRYFFRPDDEEDFPDPASQYQPDGVHGPSAVVDHGAFAWQDSAWRGIPFRNLILYELHVGTFTPEGTFEAIIPRLAQLAEVGINALELMPVNQFPGSRNWGYDGVFPYAVQDSYGGPEGLKKMVDACHAHGIAVFLDVVYNHIGPEGNYFGKFGPYFTSQYCTPWGDALNFDRDWSEGARDYFSNNPLYWFEKFHIDGLRVDAIHTIYDTGAVNFWELTYHKIRQLEQRLGRSLPMIAESDLNSPRVIRSPELGGYGFTAQWLDDFHHTLYVLVDEEGKQRYPDFGRMEQLAKAFTDGFVHSGEFVPFRKRKYGASSVGIPGDHFVVFNQNHDQVGNRVKGERLCMLVDYERLKVAAAAVMLSPYIPLLFMGEEYGDESPFFYFVSHSEPELVEAVRKGRKEEFADYGFDAEPPDPQDEKTFLDSKLRWQVRSEGRHRLMLEWHQQLIALRRSHPVLQNVGKDDLRVDVLGQQGLVLHRRSEDGLRHLLCLFNLSGEPAAYAVAHSAARWQKILDSRERRWLTEADDRPGLPITVEAGAAVSLPPLSITVYEASE
ncbi:malto-oligosyltrehalose trehalohydrolase [Tellurirhabdus rosea]|uniref:malto-oligosyltrehalose trehalohydrolase n=1 Tax=Tellurirhabdus rosea TaxID=2674997 RepID=UPI002250B300|nr:malto-oligosyltrehalose trehalohydrolase [Tellurirhabdus rosea]